MLFIKNTFQIIIYAGTFTCASVVFAKDMPATIYVGETQFIANPRITNLLVGSDSILLAKPVLGKGIALTGMAAGDTTVKFWTGTDSYNIDVHVAPRNLSRIKNEIQGYLIQVPGIKIDLVGDNVVVTGTSLSKADKTKVDGILSIFPNTVNLTTTLENNTRAKQKMIYLDVRIVEVSTSNIKEIGVKWNDANIQGPQVGIIKDFKKSTVFGDPNNALASNITPYPPIGPLQAYLGIASFLDSKINLMEETGTAKIVARPLLSCKNGGKASFLSGGQIPYQTAGATGTPSIEFKDYGIKLDIEPAITADGIAANILAEVSNIDNAVSVNGVPGMLTRRTQTDFVVTEGQTIVLSGLVNTSTSKTNNFIPFLGKIPGLRWLFNDTANTYKKNELLIFVTPYIYEGGGREVGFDQSIATAEDLRLKEQGHNVLIPDDLKTLPMKDLPNASSVQDTDKTELHTPSASAVK